jgi:hypothetical protein
MSLLTKENNTLEPRDLLVHLREWLNWHLQRDTKYFPDSDLSGHPHGFSGVVIPEWDVRQKLAELKNSLDQAGN